MVKNMSQQDKPPDYWEGVNDAFKLVQEFLDWKKKYPSADRTIQDYINDAVDKVNKQLTSDLRNLIGLDFSSLPQKTEPKVIITPEPVPEPALPLITPPPEIELEEEPIIIPEELHTEAINIPEPEESIPEPAFGEIKEPEPEFPSTSNYYGVTASSLNQYSESEPENSVDDSSSPDDVFDAFINDTPTIISVPPIDDESDAPIPIPDIPDIEDLSPPTMEDINPPTENEQGNNEDTESMDEDSDPFI